VRRALAALVGGAAVGPALALLALPVLTRLYTPSTVGAAATIVAWASVVSIVATARLELLVPGADTDEAAHALVRAGFWCATVVCLGVGIVATWLGLGDGVAGGAATTTTWSAAMTASLGAAIAWTLAATALRRAALVRAQAYTRAAEVQGWQGALRALLPLAAGSAWPGVPALLASELVGRLLPLSRAHAGSAPHRRVPASPVPASPVPASPVSAIAALRTALPTAAVLLPSGLLDALAIALPLPLVGRAHGVAAAGLFALAQRVVSAPAALVAPALGDLLHGDTAAQLRAATPGGSAPAAPAHPAAPPVLRPVLRPVLHHALRRLALGGGAVLLLIALLAPRFVAPLFGDRWTAAAPLLPPLALWSWAALIVVPTSRLLVLAGRSAWKLAYDVSALTLLLATVVLAPGATLVDTVWRIALGQAAAYVVYAWLIDRACAHPRVTAGGVATSSTTPGVVPVA